MMTDQAPGVLVRLSDGRVVKRGGGLPSEAGVVYQRASMVEGFEHAPIAVRRQHIETFWTLTDLERKDFFFDYLRSDFQSVVRPEQIREQADKLAEAERSLASSRAELFDVAALPASDGGPIPETVGAIDWWKTNVLERHLRKRSNQSRAKASRKIFEEVRANLIHRNWAKGVLDRLYADSVVVVAAEGDLTAILDSIANRITEDFVKIARIEWIARVEIEAEVDQQFAISIVSVDGKKLDPVQVLSEAALDLLALLVLIEVHVECAGLGQERIIALDDVFQSVDSVHRIRTLEYMAGRLRGWQLILTLHDRLWLDLATQALSRAGRTVKVYEVIGQGPSERPILRSASLTSIAELRARVAERSSSATLCATAGRVLEEVCNDLSLRLEASVTRRPKDRYTLGDLWPGVSKILRKNGPGPCREALSDIDAFLALRNIVGAHYNEWATSLSSAEAVDFANVVIRFWDATHCSTCGLAYAKFKGTGGRGQFFDFACGPDADHRKAILSDD
jgi:hypothetical protein